MPTKIEAAEHAFASYLGGKLREGEAPFGAKLLAAEDHAAFAAHIATKGFAVTFKPHEVHKDVLTVAVFSALPTAPPPVAEPTTPEEG